MWPRHFTALDIVSFHTQVALHANWPQVFTLFEHLDLLVSYRFCSPFLVLRLSPFLPVGLFYHPVSTVAIYGFQTIVKWWSQLIRISSLIRFTITAPEALLWGSTYSIVYFNSPGLPNFLFTFTKS